MLSKADSSVGVWELVCVRFCIQDGVRNMDQERCVISGSQEFHVICCY
jgi:hypothetical protein